MADKSKKQQTMLNAHLHELLVVELKDIPVQKDHCCGD